MCLGGEEVGTQIFCDISKLRFCVLSWPCHTGRAQRLHALVAFIRLCVHFARSLLRNCVITGDKISLLIIDSPDVLSVNFPQAYGLDLNLSLSSLDHVLNKLQCSPPSFSLHFHTLLRVSEISG